jgi:hypothetical protein
MAVQEEEITKKIIGVTHEGWLELNEAEGVKRYKESQQLDVEVDGDE